MTSETDELKVNKERANDKKKIENMPRNVPKSVLVTKLQTVSDFFFFSVMAHVEMFFFYFFFTIYTWS